MLCKICKTLILYFDRIRNFLKTKKHFIDKQKFYFEKIGFDRNRALEKINKNNFFLYRIP